MIRQPEKENRLRPRFGVGVSWAWEWVLMGQHSMAALVVAVAAAFSAPASALPSVTGSHGVMRGAGGVSAGAEYLSARRRGGEGIRLRGGGFFTVSKPVWPIYDKEDVPP